MSYAFTYLLRVESEPGMVYPVQSVRLSNCCCTQLGPTKSNMSGFSAIFPFGCRCSVAPLSWLLNSWDDDRGDDRAPENV